MYPNLYLPQKLIISWDVVTGCVAAADTDLQPGFIRQLLKVYLVILESDSLWSCSLISDQTSGL